MESPELRRINKFLTGSSNVDLVRDPILQRIMCLRLDYRINKNVTEIVHMLSGLGSPYYEITTPFRVYIRGEYTDFTPSIYSEYNTLTTLLPPVNADNICNALKSRDAEPSFISQFEVPMP